MKIIIFILGIILAFEGAIYALFPSAFKNLLLHMLVYLFNAARDQIYEASALAFLAGEVV